MIRLSDLRIERNLKMTEMARELNIPYTTYVGYEKGEREPDSETLVKLANHFGVSIDYLVGRTENRKPATRSDGSGNDYSVTDKDRQFIRWFRSLPPEKQKAILISQDAPEDLL